MQLALKMKRCRLDDKSPASSMQQCGATHLLDKVSDLFRPDVAALVLHNRLLAPAKAQHVKCEHSVAFGQLWYVVSPVVYAGAKAMDEKHDGPAAACQGVQAQV